MVAHSLGVSAAVVALAEGLETKAFIGLGATAYMKTWPARFSQTLGLPPELEKALYGSLYRTFPEEEWDAQGTAALAGRMRCRALFIHDRQDVEAHWTNSVAIARRWLGAELMVTEGMGHYRIVGAPETVARGVAFLSEVRT
jgi:pimeloyl-ACP methyl ester carboxylesterase